MIRLLGAGCVAVLSLSAATPPLPATLEVEEIPVSPSTLVNRGRDATERAMEAEQGGEPATAFAYWRLALSLRPDHPSLILNAAAAAAQTGDIEAALLGLERYVSMGLTAAIDKEPAFTALYDLPRFAAVLSRLASNRGPSGHAEVSWTIPVPGFFAEAIAFDPIEENLYLSSFRDGRIICVHHGDMTVIHRSDLSVLGLAIDPSRRLLWATATAIPEARPETAEMKGMSDLIRYELDTGQATTFACTMEGGSQLGDLALLEDGRILLSDGIQRGILAFDPTSCRFHRWSAIELPSPQGIAVSEDGKTVFVADYAAGIFRLTGDGGAWIRLAGSDDLTTLGVDGLAYLPPFLIGVQNGVRPQRIVRLEINGNGSQIASWTVLASALPDFDEPTQGLVQGDNFHFVANSHWPRLGLDEESISGLPPPLILAVPIR